MKVNFSATPLGVRKSSAFPKPAVVEAAPPQLRASKAA